MTDAQFAPPPPKSTGALANFRIALRARSLPGPPRQRAAAIPPRDLADRQADSDDHTLTDQRSILRLVEDNWEPGRIGDHSFDAPAGSLLSMFDFDHPKGRRFFLASKAALRLAGEGFGD